MQLKWRIADLSLCKISKNLYYKNKMPDRSPLKDMLHEFDNLDPKILRDIFVILSDLGFPPHADASLYLCQMITFCLTKDIVLRAHTDLYPVIAEEKGISIATVESLVRKALLRAINENNCAKKFVEIFGMEFPNYLGSSSFINTITNCYRVVFLNLNHLYVDVKREKNLLAITEIAGA